MESESALDSHRVVERLKMCQCEISVPDTSFGEVAYIVIGIKKDFYHQIFLSKLRVYCSKCGTEYKNLNWEKAKGKRSIYAGETIALQNRGIPSDKVRRIIRLAETIVSHYIPSPPYHHVDEFIMRKKDMQPLFETRIRRMTNHVHWDRSSKERKKM